MTGEQLKNSILQWAIEGKLVPQDPSEESATVLLEKIRAEKMRMVKAGELKKKDVVDSEIYKEGEKWYERVGKEVKEISEEIPFDIPEGWRWCRLKYLFILNPRNCADDNLEVSFVPMKNVEGGYGNKFVDEIKKWNEVKNGFTHISNGDVAFAKITPCFQNRKSVIFEGLHNGIGAATTELHVLRIIGDLFSRLYLLYFLKSSYFIDNAKYKGTAGQQRVTRDYLDNILFPIPPLKEQERIVAKIEELQPIIDRYGKAQSELDNLNSSLPERLRKSILQEAIQGKLVPQDSREAPASDLLKSIAAEKAKMVKEGKLKKKDISDSEIYKSTDGKWYERIGKKETCIDNEIPFDIPDSWRWVRLGSYVDLLGGYAFTSQDLKSEKGIRVIRISDFNSDGLVNNKVVRYNGELKNNIVEIRELDILMAMTGGTVGKNFLLTELPEQLLLNQRVAIIRNNSFNINYLYNVINSSHIQGIINDSKNSTNDNISMKDIYNFTVPLPPLQEQERIVAKIEDLFNLLK